MRRGHNRPPFAPKIPGTDLRSWDVPTAIIYRPARSATTSGPRPNHWVLEFEPSRPPRIEPLMGHVSTDDPYRQIRLRFPDLDSAIAFAEGQDWRYVVREDRPATRALNPWQGREQHRLHKGADVKGAFRIASPQDRGGADHRLKRAVEHAGAVDFSPGGQDGFDPVLEASLESFPASDPPAWTGVTVAARRS